MIKMERREEIVKIGLAFILVIYLLIFIIDQERWSDFINAITAPLMNFVGQGNTVTFNIFASYNLYFYLWALSSILWIILLIIFFRWRDEKKYKEFGSVISREECLEKLRKMSPDAFENYVAYLYSKIGYNTRVVGGRGDGGVDVEAVDEKGVKHYIQCKRYKNKVGVGHIRNFYGAMVDKLTKGDCFIVSTATFTWDAKEFARNKPIELIDSLELYKVIKKVGDLDLKK
jgi:HJR/Mrr/RecB family endonuclease